MSSEKIRVCLIEDDDLMGEALCERFEMEGFDFKWYRNGRDALLALQRKPCGVVVSDIRLPDLSGEEVFIRLREARSDAPPFLFITGFGAIDQAVRLLKLGAIDYLTKPLDVNELMGRIRDLGAPVEKASQNGCPLGVSPPMRKISQTLDRLAASDGTVLLTGESGVGKEQVARQLHLLGDGGQTKPFVAVNCAAIPETLLEAELFGFEKGAFTGAAKERRGYFEQADGGTLFLDEVGDMPLTMQSKLLRAIQDRTITRVGGEALLHVEVRLICATHEDLRQMVEAGRFREDLFYRINVIHLRIPPLRERREDILWLARQFAGEQSAKRGGRPFGFSEAAERAMLSYSWPGNIRELKHCVERACVMAEGAQLTPEALFGENLPLAAGRAASGDKLIAHLDACEKRYIEQALAANLWRIGESADALGISRKNLWEKMRKHGIAEPGKKAPV